MIGENFLDEFNDKLMEVVINVYTRDYGNLDVVDVDTILEIAKELWEKYGDKEEQE